MVHYISSVVKEDHCFVLVLLVESTICLISSKVNFPSPSASACPMTASNSARVRFLWASLSSLLEMKPSLFLSKAMKTSDDMRGTVIKSWNEWGQLTCNGPRVSSFPIFIRPLSSLIFNYPGGHRILNTVYNKEFCNRRLWLVSQPSK